MNSISNDPQQQLERAYDTLVQRIKAGESFYVELDDYIAARQAVEPDAVQTGDYQQSAGSWFDIVPASHPVIVISCDDRTYFRSSAPGTFGLLSSDDTPTITNGLDYRTNDPNGEIMFMSLPRRGSNGEPFPLPPPKPFSGLKKRFITSQTNARTVNKTPKIKGETTMASKRTNQGAISIAELKNLVRDNLNALWENDPALHTKHADASMMIPPVMVWGAPGVGKSTAVRELTNELGIGFIDVRLAQREPVDMRGLPVPDEKENSVKWLVSGEWPRDPKSRGIIMFDELTAADKTLQVAAYEFILDRRLGALYSVPPGWYIMAAGNRTEDRAVACAMSSALANRFLHVEVAAEANSFLAWAKENSIHPAVINFIKIRPQLLFSQENEDLQRGWPSPRSWERVSTMLKIAEKNKRKTTLKHTVPGLIGIGAASEFLAFYKNMFYMSDTIDIAEALETGRPIPLPQKADLLHACCGAVAYHVKTAKDEKTFPAVAENFLKFVRSLPNDFAAMIMNDVESGLTGTRRWQLIEKHPLFETVKSKYAPNNLFNF